MAEKTPWNPSKTAIKRVKNPLPAPSFCRYCNGRVSVKHHNDVYGKVFGKWPWLYACENCGAMTGMHPFTDIPIGTLADEETRKARGEAKKIFIELYNKIGLDRNRAYSMLSGALDIPTTSCHFGWFDADMCEKAKQASLRIFAGDN